MSDRAKSQDYLWRDVRFALPQGFDDDSVLTFRKGGDVSLTVARDALSSTIEAYAKAQEAALQQQKLKQYQSTIAPTAAAVVVDRSFDDEKGLQVVQRQAFVARGKVVVIVTGTARAAHAEAAKKAVADVVQSIA